MGILYLVATPIGNLKDITLRALEILKQVDVIACEDTRHSLKLLNKYEISRPLISCHAHNEERCSQKIISLLKKEKNVAFLSDAGTPGISDPGHKLIYYVKQEGFAAIPIPGVSALPTILSISSLSESSIHFQGFLSVKPGKRRKRLKELLEREEGFVVYESPYRVIKLLTDLADLNPKAYVLIGREMTKIHEEYLEGSAEEILTEMSNREKILGEFCIYISQKKKLNF